MVSSVDIRNVRVQKRFTLNLGFGPIVENKVALFQHGDAASMPFAEDPCVSKTCMFSCSATWGFSSQAYSQMLCLYMGAQTCGLGIVHCNRMRSHPYLKTHLLWQQAWHTVLWLHTAPPL